uniref:Uncharacterized protein n=1 Tax=Bionectria ochroleuca TaxID=29856 RepID=A0A8H7NP02_BIOOC
MDGPPPPPPPHGGVPRSSGLPPGKYDIFVIPEHSAGSGFLYLPSLQPNANSFIAGFASALILVVVGQSMAPAFRTWWESFQGLGNVGMAMLMLGIGFGAWSLGRTQTDRSKFFYGPSTSSGQAGGQGGFNGNGGGPGGFNGEAKEVSAAPEAHLASGDHIPRVHLLLKRTAPSAATASRT